MTRLILIRHGETAWTREKRYQGDTDIPLNDKGRKDIQTVADWMKGMPVDFFYSSALLRAKQSAAIVAKAIRRTPVAEAGINEIDFGSWEGKTGTQLWKERNPAFIRWSRGEWVRPTGGEKIIDFKKRISRFFYRILKRHKNKTVAIVAHGGSIKMMLMEALKLPLRSLWMMRVDPASVSVLNSFSGFNQLSLLNFTPSLGKIKSKGKGREAWR